MSRATSERWITVQQAEEQTGLPIWLIRKAIWDKRLPSYSPNGRYGRTFIKLGDLHAFMEKSRNH